MVGVLRVVVVTTKGCVLSVVDVLRKRGGGPCACVEGRMLSD